MKFYFGQKLFEVILAVVLLLTLVGLSAVTLVPYVFEIRSTKGNINAKLVYVRASIPGHIILNNYKSGQWISVKEKLGIIKNSRENSLIIRREELKSQLATSKKQIENFQKVQEEYYYLIKDVSRYIELQNKRITQQYKVGEIKTNFEIKRLKQQVNQANADLDIKVEEKRIAEKEANRFKLLLDKGAVAANYADKLRATANQAQKEVEKAYEQYKQTVVQLDASKFGFSSEQIDYLGKIEDTKAQQQQLIIHKQQLLTEVIKLEHQSVNIQAQIQAIKNELQKIEKQIQVNTLMNIQSPINGPIWSAIVQSH